MCGAGVQTRNQTAQQAQSQQGDSASTMVSPSQSVPSAAANLPVTNVPSTSNYSVTNDTDKPLNEKDLGYFIASSEGSRTFFNGDLIVSTTTLIQVTGPKGIALASHIPAFKRHLEKILDELSQKAKPHEHFQIILGCKHAEGSNYVKTKFFRADDPHGIAYVMTLIERSVQSNAKWLIDDEIEVCVKHVKNGPHAKVGIGKRYVSFNPLQAVKGRHCFVEIVNKNDKMCLPRAIAVIERRKRLDKAKIENASEAEIKELEAEYEAIKRKNCRVQEQEARSICRRADIDPQKTCGNEEIKNIENVLDIYIKLVASDQYNEIVYDGVSMNFRPHIPVVDANVYFVHRRWVSDLNAHHVDAIVNHKAFFDNPYYCLHCNKHYRLRKRHRCTDVQGWCYSCWDRDCKVDPDFQVKFCSICGIKHRNQKCQDIHEKESLCKEDYFCAKCKQVVKRKKYKKRGTNSNDFIYETNESIQRRHKCLKKCHLCNEFVDAVFHKCFIKKVEFKEPSEKLLFFDIETDQSTKTHEPIYFHAIWYDPETKQWLEQSFWIKTTPDIRQAVGEFLFSKQFQGYTMMAHNMKGFDGCFLLQYLGRNGLKATPIFSGRKIISLDLKPLKIRIIDSLSFLLSSLALLGESFDLKECTKGHFPHFFACPENYSYKGDLPPMEAYGYNLMKPAAREAFIKWYIEVSNSDMPIKFDFERDIALYCRQDVFVLKEACMAFKNLLMELTENQCDPFQYTTLASVSSAVFKALFLKKDTIAAVPPNGYADIQNFSSVSLEWLEWLREKKGISNLKHIANSAIGEATIAGYKVDGIDVDNKTVYEFYGCYYHGCPVCFKERNSLNKGLGKTFDAVHTATLDRALLLETLGWKVVSIWECEWKRMKDEDPEIEKFVSENKHRLTPMSPFDSFFGGRVEVFKMLVNDDRRMNYEDITSLYPFINATKVYPVGHPEIILSDFGSLDTVCDRYFGFMKCRILPPDQLYTPVLPGKYGLDKKLLFTLCRMCAEERTPECRCVHSIEERALTGTWFIEEIKLAIEMGYQLLEVFGVYHFAETSTDLFADYIRLFYKLKLISSGRPSQCTSDEELDAYIAEVEKREKIKLSKEEFKKNPGMRQLSKLLINSLWGKFGLRRNLPSHKFCSTIHEISNLLHDESSEVTNILPMHENLALVTSRKKSAEHFEINNHANIYIASATTAWARIELYKHMRRVGGRIVYVDTDCLIYVKDFVNLKNNLLRGPFLGQFTNELKNQNDHIKSFLAGGPKNYGFQTEQGEECLKVKGFCLNYTNKQAFTFENMKEVILNFLDIDPHCDAACDETVHTSKVISFSERASRNMEQRDHIRETFHKQTPEKPSAVATPKAISVYNPQAIARSQTWELLSKAEQKLYTVNYDKRIVTETFDTYPFGYRF